MRASAAPRQEWRPRPKATWRSTADHHGPVYGPRLVREISKTGKTSPPPTGRASFRCPAGGAKNLQTGTEIRTVQGWPLRHLVHGFDQASRVVVAAAVIMVSVLRRLHLHPRRDDQADGLRARDRHSHRRVLGADHLTPALMALFGDKAWWLPRWLDRILPDLDVGGPTPPDAHPTGGRRAITASRRRRPEVGRPRCGTVAPTSGSGIRWARSVWPPGWSRGRR